MRPYANLHLHSTHSDGKYTPEQLVLLAKEEGYGAIAVTDHDTVTANEEIAFYAKKHGLESIFGCEFSVEADGGNSTRYYQWQETISKQKKIVLAVGTSKILSAMKKY